MLWARLGEANNLFTEYRVLTDSECLANSSEVTKRLEPERGCGAQLVEWDYGEGRWLPSSSQDTAHSIFWKSRVSLLGEHLRHWAGGDHLCLTTPANEHFSNFGCRNWKCSKTPPKCSWHSRQGTPVGDRRSGPLEQQKNSVLLSCILEECPYCPLRKQRQSCSTRLLPPCMNSAVIPPFFIHPEVNQGGQTQGLISLAGVGEQNIFFLNLSSDPNRKPSFFMIFIVQD